MTRQVKQLASFPNRNTEEAQRARGDLFNGGLSCESLARHTRARYSPNVEKSVQEDERCPPIRIGRPSDRQQRRQSRDGQADHHHRHRQLSDRRPGPPTSSADRSRAGTKSATSGMNLVFGVFLRRPEFGRWPRRWPGNDQWRDPSNQHPPILDTSHKRRLPRSKA